MGEFDLMTTHQDTIYASGLEITGDSVITGDQTVSGDLTADGDTNVQVVYFDTAAAPPDPIVEGARWWEDGVSNSGTPFEDVVMQDGLELQSDIRTEVGALTNGQVVYTVGTSGTRSLVDLAQADSAATSCALGVMTHDIGDNSNGRATTYGLVRNVDTTESAAGETWAAGESLFLSATIAGGLSNVAPTAPNHVLRIGQVGRVHESNGDIKVCIGTSSAVFNGRYVLANGDSITGNYIIDTGTLRIGDGTNNATWDTDGTLTLNGTATVWDDLRVPFTAIRIGPAGEPDFAQVLDDGGGSTGVFAYHFDKTTEEQLHFSVQLPHTWKEGSTIYPHIHWMPSDTDTGDVIWGIEYTWSNIGAVFGNTTILEATEAGGGTALEHIMTEWSGITATGKTHSSMLLCRVFRKAADGSDDYDADAIGLEVDFHYEINALGDDDQPGV